MKKSLLTVLAVSVVFGITGSIMAATTPSLGAAVTYGVLASTYTDTSASTTINGDVGFTTPPATAPLGVHTNYGLAVPYSTAGIDQNSALSVLASQPCTYMFPDTDVNLAIDTTHGPIGVYAPWVYCTQSTRAASIGTAGITLSGAGTYIFRINGALTSVANSVVTLSNGASACNVFWTPSAATTLGANSTFVGTDIDAAGITVGSNVTWLGMALWFGGTVTTNADTITVPTCSIAPVVIIPVVIPPVVISTGTLPRPIINIVKIPNRITPFPFGGGTVMYTYTVTNPGVVAMHDVVVVDDKCSSPVLIGGDTNRDHLLDTTETWTYNCQMYVSASTRNVAVAEGRANGFVVQDQDFANVYVSAPVVPLLPKTGIMPEEENSTTPLNIIILASIFMVASTSLIIALRKNKI